MTTPFRTIFDRALVGIAYTDASGGILEARYQKGKPLSYTADRIEFFKKGGDAATTAGHLLQCPGDQAICSGR
jgi:hypothetical protein